MLAEKPIIEPRDADALLSFLRKAPKGAETANELIQFVDSAHESLVEAHEESGRLAREANIEQLPLQTPSKGDLLRYLIDGPCRDVWNEISREAVRFSATALEGKKQLPVIQNASLHLALHKDEEPPEQLVEGMLHVGERLMFSGASKAGKSWGALDFAVSVGDGIPFWGMETKQGRVLYLNYELGDYHFYDRLEAVAKARNASVQNIDVIPLQQHWGDFERVRDYLIVEIMKANRDGDPYALVIIDPLYSLLEGKNENDNAEMARMMSDIGNIAVETGSAVAMVHHFAKGNSSAKSSIDRASGAGVFARYPDCIVTLDRHQENDGRVAEFTLRNFPDRENLGLRFEYPIFVPDEELDTKKLEGRNNGNEALATLPEIVALAYEIGNEGETIKKAELRAKAAERFGYSKAEHSSLYELVKQAIQTGKLESAGRGNVRIPVD